MPAPPGHLQVGRNLRGEADLRAQAEARKKTIESILEKDGDATDVMFVSGRSDLLRGVIKEPGWHYLVVGEDWSRGDRALINYGKFMREGYSVAKLPDGTPAAWPEIGLHIMRVPQERYDRYRRAIRLLVEEANGGVDLAKGSGHKQSKAGAFVFDETQQMGMASANDLGITGAGVVS